MSNQMLILITGPRSSGKTSLANSIISNLPNFARISIDNLANMNITAKSTPKEISIGRSTGYELSMLVFEYFFNKGKNVVIDDHFEEEDHLDKLIKHAVDKNVELIAFVLDVNKQNMVLREQARPYKQNTFVFEPYNSAFTKYDQLDVVVIDTDDKSIEDIYMLAKEKIEAKLQK